MPGSAFTIMEWKIWETLEIKQTILPNRLKAILAIIKYDFI